MPSARTQRYLTWIGGAGIFASCFGCSLLATNQVNASVAFLVLAWLILTPLFVYLLTARRRTKRIVREHEDRRERELEALASARGFLPATKDQGPKTNE